MSLTPADLSYNNRLQLTYFKLTHPTVGAGAIYESAYEYSAEGLVKFISDKRAWSIQEGWPPTENMHHFDRGYIYDHAARLTQALTGDEARGGTNADGPYKETYQYDAFNHMTSRVNRIWSKPLDSFTHTYVNNRIQEWPAQYDAEGNNVSEGSFDAMSRKMTFDTYLLLSLPPVSNELWYSATASVTYDGDGQMVKEQDTMGSTTYVSLYFIRSTVLGGQDVYMVKDEPFNGQGVVTRMVSIYANGDTIARSTNGTITFEPSEPLTGRRAGVEVDPLGQEVGSFDPGPEEPGNVGHYPEPHEFGNAEDPSMGCTLDGITIDCATLARFTNPLSPRWTSLFLPRIWRPSIPQRTPSTFPSPQPPIQLNRVLSEVFAGTPIGNIFFPRAQDLWKYVAIDDYTPQKGSDPASLFQKFLKANPECAKKVQAAGDKLGLGDYAKYPWKITDTFTKELWEKPGVIPGQEKPELTVPKKYFDAHPGWAATTLVNKEGRKREGTFLGELYHVFYIWNPDQRPGTPVFISRPRGERSRQLILFDESLHNYFDKGHKDLADLLGVKYDPGKTAGQADRNALLALENWAKGGCK